MSRSNFPNDADGREALRLLVMSGLLRAARDGAPTGGMGEEGWMKLLRAVSPLQGATIVLRIIHGWDNVRSAGYLGSTPQAVSMCVRLGLKRLAECEATLTLLESATLN